MTPATASTETTDIHARFDITLPRELDHKMVAAVEEAENAITAHLAVWPTDDPDRLDLIHERDRPRFRQDIANLRATRQALREKQQNIRAEKEDLPRRKEIALQTIQVQIVWGPPIPIAAVILPARDDDRALKAFSSKRDAALVEQQTHEHELAELEPMVPKMEATVGDVQHHFQHKLATGAEVEREHARLAALQAAISAHRAAIGTLDAAIATLDAQIEQREKTFEAERLAALDTAITKGAFQMADDLMRAMASSTTLRRLLCETGAGRWMWTLPALNADDPKSDGRELLERALSLGWQPSKGK
jgi:DNA repair exonuclease SbcCD ATPase subunit